MPLIHGGIQESGRRAGTENVPGIIGFGRAAALAQKELPEKIDHVRKLRDRLVDGILKRVEKVTYTGHPQKRLPGHASFCFEAIEGEALIFMLAQNGIYTNTGSACASKALKTSPVLGAIGLRQSGAKRFLNMKPMRASTETGFHRPLRSSRRVRREFFSMAAS